MTRIFFILLLLAPSLSAQQDVTADAHRAAQPISKTPDPTEPGKPSDVMRKWEGGVGNVDTAAGKFHLGGYATFLHRTVAPVNGGDSLNFFDAVRFVPQFEWTVAKWLEFAAEVEFEGGGIADFLEDSEIIVEYAEARLMPLDEFNVRAGLLLIPFGRYNRNHDDVLWDLADRPYVAKYLIPTAFDQPGIGIYGSFNQVPFLGIHYDLTVTQGFTDGFSSEEGAHDVAVQSFRGDNNDNKALWFRLGLTPDIPGGRVSADLGWSFTYQELAPGNRQALRGTGVDGLLKFDIHDRFGIQLTGEWSRFWIHRPSDAVATNGLSGYFVDVLFKFDPFPAAWRSNIFGAHPYIGLIFRIEQNDLNDDFVGAAPNDDRIAFTVGLSFRPLSKLVVRFEWKNRQSRGQDEGDQNDFVFSFSIGM